jgi:hypothetical protein
VFIKKCFAQLRSAEFGFSGGEKGVRVKVKRLVGFSLNAAVNYRLSV